MTAPLFVANREEVVRAALLQARRRGYELSAATLARMQKVFESAARTIVARTAAGKMTQKRADELMDALAYVLLDVEREVVVGVTRSVTMAVTQTPRTMQTAFEKLAYGRAGLAARFNRVPTRAIVALYGKRQIAAPLKALTKRNMGGVEPEVVNIIAEGMAVGKDSREIAKDIQQVMLGNQPDGVPDAPNLRTMLSDAKRIARTEVANALREATAQSLTESRIVQAAKWQTSSNHMVLDECDDLENDDIGYGPGYYPPEDWPDAPHPNCSCYAGDVLLRPVDQWGLAEQPKPGEQEKQEEQWGEPIFADFKAPPHTVFIDNVEEIAQKMEDKYGIQIGFAVPEDTPIWAVNDQMRVWEAMLRRGYKFPDYMEWAYDREFSDITVGGYSWLLSDDIKWNLGAAVFKSPEMFDWRMWRSVNEHWWTAQNLYGVYTHEPAHYLHALNLRNVLGPRSDLDRPGTPLFMMSKSGQKWQEWGNAFPDPKIEQMVYDQVGEYASKAPAEFVAEVFTGLINGQTYSKEIMDLYAQYYGPDVIPVPNLPKYMPKNVEMPKPTNLQELIAALRGDVNE